MPTDQMEIVVRPPLRTAARGLALALAVLGSAVLAGYSTPKEAYAELIPAFNRTPEGQGVRFDQSYGASGDQSRAVESGLPADVVALSLAPDVDRLGEPGLVDAEWG